MKLSRFKYWFSFTVLLAIVALYSLPILFMLSGSLKPDDKVLSDVGSVFALIPRDVSLQNYRDVFNRVPFAQYMFNSLFISAMVVFSGLVVNSLAAYSLARLRWRGRTLILNLILAVMILPLEAIVVPLFYQVSLFGWLDSYFVQILPFIANAFSIYLFYTFFVGLPREFEEAAYLDGATSLRTFTSIVVPNSKPVFASVAVLSFLTQWSAFIWPLMVTHSEGVRPLALAISTFYTLPPLQWGDIFAFGVMMVTPVLVLFLMFQSWFVKGVAASAIKG